MTDAYGDEVQVLREREGWTVTCGGQRLKRFTGRDEFQTLGRACDWGSKYAEARGLAAWFLHEGRRTPITLKDRSGLWTARK